MGSELAGILRGDSNCADFRGKSGLFLGFGAVSLRVGVVGR